MSQRKKKSKRLTDSDSEDETTSDLTASISALHAATLALSNLSGNKIKNKTTRALRDRSETKTKRDAWRVKDRDRLEAVGSDDDDDDDDDEDDYVPKATTTTSKRKGKQHRTSKREEAKKKKQEEIEKKKKDARKKEVASSYSKLLIDLKNGKVTNPTLKMDPAGAVNDNRNAFDDVSMGGVADLWAEPQQQNSTPRPTEEKAESDKPRTYGMLNFDPYDIPDNIKRKYAEEQAAKRAERSRKLRLTKFGPDFESQKDVLESTVSLFSGYATQDIAETNMPITFNGKQTHHKGVVHKQRKAHAKDFSDAFSRGETEFCRLIYKYGFLDVLSSWISPVKVYTSSGATTFVGVDDDVLESVVRTISVQASPPSDKIRSAAEILWRAKTEASQKNAKLIDDVLSSWEMKTGLSSKYRTTKFRH